MKVFKFGGASVNSIERIKNLGQILHSYSDETLLVVISAMGKTTNALEKVVEAFYAGRKDEALQFFEKVKEDHLDTARQILQQGYAACEQQLRDFFTEVEWLLHDNPQREFDYYYDQVVCVGELMSTSIISHYLHEAGQQNNWLDVRDIMRTDDNFRDATVDWDFTSRQVHLQIKPLLAPGRLVLTQGYIGATDENESTTLGREGSDYSAAVFANILDAESLTIWKDVESVMSADPRQFPNAVPLHELNYAEVIEMAYYGAQVIHPKTIKPLQNKGIPLFVKCFLKPALAGTHIHHQSIPQLPPVIVLKENQVLLEMRSRDFSFIGEHHVGHIYQLLEEMKLKPSLTQNGAISFLCVLDHHEEKIQKLALDASSFVDVQVMKGYSLLTIRHYTRELLDQMTEGKMISLKQQTRETVQVLYA